MVHYYFKSRDQLIDAVVLERIVPVIGFGLGARAAEQDAAPAADPAAAARAFIAEIVGRLVRCAAERPWLPALWLHEVSQRRRPAARTRAAPPALRPPAGLCRPDRRQPAPGRHHPRRGAAPGISFHPGPDPAAPGHLRPVAARVGKAMRGRRPSTPRRSRPTPSPCSRAACFPRPPRPPLLQDADHAHPHRPAPPPARRPRPWPWPCCCSPAAATTTPRSSRAMRKASTSTWLPPKPDGWPSCRCGAASRSKPAPAVRAGSHTRNRRARPGRRALAAAAAQLEDIATGKRPAEVDVTRAQLAQAEAAARRSAAQLRRDTEQFRIGGIARAQLDDSREQAQSDTARVRELKAQLDVAALPGRDDQRLAQAAQVEAARAALAQAGLDPVAEAPGRARRGAGVRYAVPRGRMGAGGQPRGQPAAAGQHQGAPVRARDGPGQPEDGPAAHGALRQLRRPHPRAHRLHLDPGRIHAARHLQPGKPQQAGLHDPGRPTPEAAPRLHPGQPLEAALQ